MEMEDGFSKKDKPQPMLGLVLFTTIGARRMNQTTDP
jgi:hypothetical protein